jgi:transcription initiation factor TFIIF subunit beta
MRSNIVDNMNEHKWNQALNKQFANFVQHQNKPKSQLNKAARISKDLLLDMLHKCFDKYMYWPMKALKKETQQPEAYLKDCLEEIADLVRTGTFASNWMRKAMFDTPNSVAQNAIAPALEDEDGDEEEMEDVM